MKTEPLTKEEKTWLRRLEKVLMNPPTDRIGFYTIGDAELIGYDRSRQAEIDNEFDGRERADFCMIVAEIDAEFRSVSSKCQILSTAG